MATSVVAGLMDLYETISASHFGGTRPRIYLDSAPAVDETGAQLRVPYVVLHDRGAVPTYHSSFGGTESGELVLEVFGTTLALVDTYVSAIKYGGSAPSAKAGLDFGSITLTGHLKRVELRRVKETRSYAGFNQASARVHKCELVYKCITEFLSTA